MTVAQEIMAHPVLTTATGIATGALGALNNLAPDTPIVHDLLSDGAMMLGCIATMVGIAVQIRNWNIKGLEQVKLQQEIDKGRREEIAVENSIYVPNKTPDDMVKK